MTEHPNEWYLNGIKNGSDEVIQTIFDNYLPMITGFICANSGNRDDAKDVFMDAMEAVYRKLRNGDLTLTSKFSTYLYEICKRLWYKRLRRKKWESAVTPDDPVVSNQVKEIDAPIEETERLKLLWDKFALLPDDCKKALLSSWHTDMDMKEIARMMDWTYGYARKRKHLCVQQLMDLIKRDNRFEELSYDQ